MNVHKDVCTSVYTRVLACTREGQKWMPSYKYWDHGWAALGGLSVFTWVLGILAQVLTLAW